MPAHEFEAAAEDDGQRLDVVLARRVEALSRARAKSLIESGRVEVEGRRRAKNHRLSAGDRVVIAELPASNDFYCEPDPELPLEVLTETEHFVVVDKAAGVPSHPLRAGERGTLAGALVARYPEMRDIGYGKREPGILHRLDTGTSGVMLAARTSDAFDELRDLLRANDRRITIEDIQKRVAEHYNMRIADMHSPRRARAIARPRQVAMYLAKQLTTRSLPEIGRKFGGRDHTTVMHAVRKIEELRQTESGTAEDVDLLKRMIEG